MHTQIKSESIWHYVWFVIKFVCLKLWILEAINLMSCGFNAMFEQLIIGVTSVFLKNSLNVHECVHFEWRTKNNQKLEMLLLNFLLITWACTWIWHQILKLCVVYLKQV
jgi:hypothetical protein